MIGEGGQVGYASANTTLSTASSATSGNIPNALPLTGLIMSLHLGNSGTNVAAATLSDNNGTIAVLSAIAGGNDSRIWIAGRPFAPPITVAVSGASPNLDWEIVT